MFELCIVFNFFQIIIFFFLVIIKEILKLLKRFFRYDLEGKNGGIILKQFLDILEIFINLVMFKVVFVYFERRIIRIIFKLFIKIMFRFSYRNFIQDKKECEL